MFSRSFTGSLLFSAHAQATHCPCSEGPKTERGIRGAVSPVPHARTQSFPAPAGLQPSPCSLLPSVFHGVLSLSPGSEWEKDCAGPRRGSWPWDSQMHHTTSSPDLFKLMALQQALSPHFCWATYLSFSPVSLQNVSLLWAEPHQGEARRAGLAQGARSWDMWQGHLLQRGASRPWDHSGRQTTGSHCRQHTRFGHRALPIGVWVSSCLPRAISRAVPHLPVASRNATP